MCHAAMSANDSTSCETVSVVNPESRSVVGDYHQHIRWLLAAQSGSTPGVSQVFRKAVYSRCNRESPYTGVTLGGARFILVYQGKQWV